VAAADKAGVRDIQGIVGENFAVVGDRSRDLYAQCMASELGINIADSFCICMVQGLSAFLHDRGWIPSCSF